MTFALALTMCLGFLLPVFSNLNLSSTASAVTVITPLETIIDSDISQMPDSNMRSDASGGNGQTPFDENTRKIMPGYSVTPRANEYNEISNRIYNVSEFTVGREISIFIWIYFPDDPLGNYYDLNLKFTNNHGEVIEWNLPYDKLYEMMYPLLSYDLYGWKQLELVYNDAQKNFTDTGNKKFTSFQISYKVSEAGSQLPNRTTNGTLSIYNAFTSSRMSEITNIFRSTNYAYYGFNSSFLQAFYNLYIGASYKLKAISDIFDYIYVGKSNLTLNGLQNNFFEWQISLKHYSDEIDDIRIGDTLAFDTAGEYVLTIKLFEQVSRAGKREKREILTATHTISIMKYTFGMFSSSTYNVDKNSVITLRFDVTDDFVPEESFGFSVENEKIATIESFEYDSNLHAYFVEIKGIKKGTTKVKISAKGYRESDKVSTDFVETTNVVVKYSGLSPWLLTLIYVILGFYGVAFVIFLSISFVNSRRNIVK